MRKLTEIILKHGIENVYFLSEVHPLRKILFVSYTSSNDPLVEVPCRIIEGRYKVEEGYKITLKPIYNGFETRDYYVSDLESLIEEGHIQLLIKTKLR